MTAGDGRLWSPAFVLTITVNFLGGIVFWALMTWIAAYAIQRLGASEAEAGLIGGMVIIGAVFSRVLLSRFIVLFGQRRMMLIGYALFAITTALYFVAPDLATLTIVRFLNGVGFGLAHTAVTAVAMSLIPPRRRAEGTGYYGVAAAASPAIGPLAGVALAGVEHGVLAGATACALLVFIVALFIRVDELPTASDAARTWWRYRLTDLVEPKALGVAAVMALSGAAFSGVMVFLVLHAQQLGLSDAAGFFFVVYAVAVVLARLLLGRAQDRLGDNSVVYPLLAAFVAGLILLSVAADAIVLLAAGALLGSGYGGLMTALQATAVRLSPPNRISTAVATYYTGLDIGSGIGPMLLGLIVAATGYAEMFLWMAGVVLVATVLYVFVHGARGGGRPQYYAA